MLTLRLGKLPAAAPGEVPPAPADPGQLPQPLVDRMRGLTDAEYRKPRGIESLDNRHGRADDLAVHIQKRGGGATAHGGTTVSVRVVGKHRGKTFWSTAREAPFVFTVGLRTVIEALAFGVEGMRVGEQRVITAGPRRAYGTMGFPKWGIPGNATVQFEVELLTVQQQP